MNEIAQDDRWSADVSDEPGNGPGGSKGRVLGHRITIEAPPELVWDFVADFEGWASWNPLYSDTSGTAEDGETLRFVVRRDGLKPRKGRAHVSRVRPHALLEFRQSSMAGLIQVHRHVEIEELSPTRCRVVAAEIVGGPLGALVSRTLGPRIAGGMKAMNAALKQVAERKWRGRPS